MKKTMIAVSLLSVALLSACGSESPAPSTARPINDSAIDMDVAAILPQGSFTVTGGFANSEGPFSAIDGYVKYGTDPDGKDCEADYTIAHLTDAAVNSGTVAKQRSVRTAGETSWYQDVSNPGKLGEWIDNADPDSAQIALLFTPNLVVDDFGVPAIDGAGTGELCAIPLMARIMKLENGELSFDTKRAAAMSEARVKRWVEGLVDAVGVTGSERQNTVDMLVGLSKPSFYNLMEQSVIKITKNGDGSYIIVQEKKDGTVMVSMKFSPTDERAIEPITGTTYFEKVTEEVKSSGLTPIEFLNKYS